MQDDLFESKPGNALRQWPPEPLADPVWQGLWRDHLESAPGRRAARRGAAGAGSSCGSGGGSAAVQQEGLEALDDFLKVWARGGPAEGAGDAEVGTHSGQTKTREGRARRAHNRAEQHPHTSGGPFPVASCPKLTCPSIPL